MAVYYKDRVKGGVGLIVTGGIAPNFVGCISLRDQVTITPFRPKALSERGIK